jgi:LacI family transcriptional regulator
LADPFFSVVSHAVQETARENGYLVWLAASNDDPTIEAAQVEQMTHHPVDGILLVPVDSKHKYLKSVAEGATPVVTIDRPIEVAASDSVEVENRTGARMAVEHLIQHRYKRIACVATNTHLVTIKERLIGYEECMRKAKLPRPKIIRSTSQHDVKAALKELFESRTWPDALFSANNAATIWTIEALRELKIEIGREVALVGFDDVDFYSLISPPITTIRQPAPELGHTSARLLLQRIKGESPTLNVRPVLPVTLAVRESCGCRRKE